MKPMQRGENGQNDMDESLDILLRKFPKCIFMTLDEYFLEHEELNKLRNFHKMCIHAEKPITAEELKSMRSAAGLIL